MSSSFCNLASALPKASHPSSNTATLSLPTELWTIIFDFAVYVPIFFDARWDNGIITPFDEASQPLSPQESYKSSLVTKKAILLVCRHWNSIAHGILFRQIVIRREGQLISLIDLLETDALGSRSPLGWHVTHVKILITTNDDINKAKVVNLVRRLIASCPRLVLLQDAAPYGLNESPLDYYVTDPSSPTRPKQLQALVWSYGGPRAEDFEDDTGILKQTRSLQCTTIHMAPSPADLNPPIPIALPNLISLDLSISWNNHLPWQSAAERLSFPALRHLTIRAPVLGDGALTSESVQSLEAFLDAHGKTLRSLDVHILPRAEARSTLLLRSGDLTENVVDIGAILARCPNLVDIVLSARWLSADSPSFSPPAVASGGDDSEGRPVRWQHANLERVGLRDVGMKSTCTAAGWALETMSPVPRPTLLRSDSLVETSKRYQSFAATMRVLLDMRGVATGSYYAPGPGTRIREGGKRSFPALRAIQVLDAHLNSLTTEMGDLTEDGVFWEEWNLVARGRGVSVGDCCGSPIFHRRGLGMTPVSRMCVCRFALHL